MVEMIEVVCATCGTPNPVDDSAAGTLVACVTCKARIGVPARDRPIVAPPPIPSRATALGVGITRRPEEEMDLPAPVLRRAGPGIADDTGSASPPSPSSRLDRGRPSQPEMDLPAPKRASAVASLDLDDLLGPNHAESDLDPMAGLGAPRLGDIVDLPAPKAAQERRSSSELSDLLAPKRDPRAAHASVKSPQRAEFSALDADQIDLPAPRAGIVDLPAPKRGVADGSSKAARAPLAAVNPPGIVDLPTPKYPAAAPARTSASPPHIADLPTPRVGGFSGLPMPKSGEFANLPIPVPESSPELPVPKGFFDDLPQPALLTRSTDLAPKGFFEDLPKPANAATTAVAPKGFFEGVPGRPSSPALRAKTPSAPGSLFDDIPLPTGAKLEDLGLRATPPPAPPSPPPQIDLGLSHSSIDLGLPPPSRPSSASLPPPMSARSSMPSIPVATIASTPVLQDPGAVAPILARPRATEKAKASERSPRRTRFMIAAVLGIAAVGGGGVYGYQRYSASVERREQIADGLSQASRALVAVDPGHWQRAATAAKQVLALDENNAEALGIAAEAHFAGALDDGISAVARIRTGKQLLAKATAEAINTPPIQRARALAALVGGKAEQIDRAKQILAEMLAPAGAANATLLLYAGWAKAAANDPDAMTTLDQALGIANAHKLSVLLARGQLKLALGDLPGARTDYAAALEIDKASLAAQVGIAAALPSAQSQQREGDLLAILQRKDLGNGDPRAITRAWLLAGDEARRGGRLEVARERYQRGLEISPEDLAVNLSITQLELAKGRIETAKETIEKVLAVNPDDARAMLVAAEVDLAFRQPESASKRLDSVRARNAGNPWQKARLALLSGRLLEQTERFDDALVLYRQAIDLVGEADLEPTMTAVDLLTRLADRTDPTQADALRAEVETLLLPLTKRAIEDSSVAVTLGASYLAANNPTKAMEWLTRAVAQRPDDVDASFQLAKASAKLGKVQDAIDLLSSAFQTSPQRGDIGAELAKTMEDAGRIKDAAALYDKLLAAPDVTVGLRAHAGRFLARNGQIERAAREGEAILKQVPEGDAAGYFLRGIGALQARKLDDARRDLQRAVNLDRDPDYLDALAHASEELGNSSKDSKYMEEALRAYSQAAELRPTVSALHGIGRLRLQRRESQKALDALLRANQMAGSDGDVLFLIGVAYQDLRQFKAAAAWFTRANEVQPRAEVNYRLGLSQLELEQAGPAAAALTRATEVALGEEKQGGAKVEWLTDALYLLGRIEFDRRNGGSARRAWEGYLGRGPTNRTQVDEVKRLLLGLRTR